MIVAAISLHSCHTADEHNGKTPIAKVYDRYLYYEDLGDLLPKDTDPIDSVLKVKQYIHVWARQQLMIKMAEIYLKDQEKDVERQLEEYRNNLLIYRYKDRYISENLDTVVTLKQSTDYYQNHPDDFVLNSPAVKSVFVMVPAENDELQQIRKLLDFHSEKDSLLLIDLCKQHAVKFDNFDNNWTPLHEASQYMPDIISEKNDAIKTNGTITINDGQYAYMLKIRDHIAPGGVMPFNMAESSINRILINKRKTSIVNELEQTLIDEAFKSKNLEYFSADKQDTETNTQNIK